MTTCAICASLILIYILDLVLCVLDQGMLLHHISTTLMCLFVLVFNLIIWDGTPLSTYDAIGWGLWRSGFIATAFRASVFEALYFGITFWRGPGWQYEGWRVLQFRCMMTVVDDGWQVVSAFLCGSMIWYHPDKGAFGGPITRTIASSLAFAHGSLLAPWVLKAIKKLLSSPCAAQPPKNGQLPKEERNWNGKPY
jgi:hypothetical protein